MSHTYHSNTQISYSLALISLGQARSRFGDPHPSDHRPLGENFFGLTRTQSAPVSRTSISSRVGNSWRQQPSSNPVGEAVSFVKECPNTAPFKLYGSRQLRATGPAWTILNGLRHPNPAGHGFVSGLSSHESGKLVTIPAIQWTRHCLAKLRDHFDRIVRNAARDKAA